MNKRNWLCKIRINGRICFSDYLTNYEVAILIMGVDVLDVKTHNRDDKQEIVISNKYFVIEMNEL